MQIYFLNFEEKNNNIDMAQNSTQITGFTFSELKLKKRKAMSEN